MAIIESNIMFHSESNEKLGDLKNNNSVSTNINDEIIFYSPDWMAVRKELQIYLEQDLDTQC